MVKTWLEIEPARPQLMPDGVVLTIKHLVVNRTHQALHGRAIQAMTLTFGFRLQFIGKPQHGALKLKIGRVKQTWPFHVQFEGQTALPVTEVIGDGIFTIKTVFDLAPLHRQRHQGAR